MSDEPIIKDQTLIARVTLEMGQNPLTCPNCSKPITNHKANGCMLATLVYVLCDRIGEVGGPNDTPLTEEDVLRAWVTADPDLMWDDIGPILNNLQDGVYKVGDGT